MAKPRVIIADEDVNYIIPLQLKFVKDFFDKIDLEIISDRDFVKEFFSKPQMAEVLIISEELYDSSLQKHNIANTFVMMEQFEEGGTEDLNINKLYKYTSVQEIFNEIVGKSSEVLNINSDEKKETQIVLVTSAAGGTGKTTIAMGVAACLAKNFKRVLYINASRLQSFQYMLDNNTALSSPEVYARFSNTDEQIYSDIKHVIRKEIFSYLPSFKASLMSLGLQYSIYEQLALSAKNSMDYDFIVIDTDSTFDDDKTRLLDIANKVLIVTDQTYSGVMATNALIANINGLNADKYVFVCNKFKKDNYNALTALELVLKFTVNEYVNYIEINGMVKCEKLSQNKGIKKVSFLVT